MDLGRREADQGAAPEFVALDIRGDEESPGPGPDLMVESSIAAKGFERDRSTDANSSSIGMVSVYEKQVVPVHVDGSPREQYHPSTPKRRRPNRRVPVWRDPRKILFAFAALSSVGTLILLYFTLSMGTKAGGQGDDR